ncbi:sigma-70 family RNA polymerase sigma factor [Pseudofrankia sp. BMG5.37]|uniref:RNA polymerase sigma factor n=1 Tax=Pseudofrankia sp. BMG5.37 TaxID=3050035 RepID=UPI0028953BF7|nr:sigma-70 family RNA polymerase sigma factor [Pseudofrankia sp. BMG5.37]MDT3438335.1 sigma-70 family RNA polymerase sigma factor [Pseudofrankia sp. BMG5.37]
MTTPTITTAGAPDDDPRGFDLIDMPIPEAADVASPPEGTEDEVLAVWSALRDPDAYGELYRRYGHNVAAHLRRRVWDRDLDEVDDLTQEVFTSALELLQAGMFPQGAFRNWLYGHVVAVVLTRYIVSRWADGRALAGMTAALLLPAPHAADGPVLSERLRAALDSLSPRRRQVLELRCIEGQSAAATAHIIGMREGSVGPLLSKAARDMYKMLAGADKPRRPPWKSMEELLPVALEVAATALAAGTPWNYSVLTHGFKARGIPLGAGRRTELDRQVRAAMPQLGPARRGRPGGLACLRPPGGAR